MIADEQLGLAIAALFAIGIVLVAFSMRPRRRVKKVAATEPVAAVAMEADAPALRWPALIDPDFGDLDEPTRVEIVAGLGALPDTWSVDVLCAAYAEERAPAVRDTIVLALARGADAAGAPALRAAAHAERGSERSLAIGGLAALGELELLEGLLGDADLSVALSALQALERSGERARIDRFVAGAPPLQAATLRAALDGHASHKTPDYVPSGSFL